MPSIKVGDRVSWETVPLHGKPVRREGYVTTLAENEAEILLLTGVTMRVRLRLLVRLGPCQPKPIRTLMVVALSNVLFAVLNLPCGGVLRLREWTNRWILDEYARWSLQDRFKDGSEA